MLWLLDIPVITQIVIPYFIRKSNSTDNPRRRIKTQTYLDLDEQTQNILPLTLIQFHSLTTKKQLRVLIEYTVTCVDITTAGLWRERLANKREGSTTTWS